MPEIGVLLSLALLILGALLAFPIYVLITLAELRRESRRLRNRLDRLEGHHPPEPLARKEPEVLRPVPPAPPPVRPPEAARPVTPPPAPPKPAAPAGRDLEAVLGANWLSKLGVAAIAIAAAFFLKYAFDSGWIGPTARIAIGLAAAAVMLGLGQWLLSKPVYRAYAQVLASGGIIILFLSIWAAYSIYHLVGFSTAFGVLAAAALAASALAVRNNTQAAALLCIAGAFLTPVLIQQEKTSAGDLIRLYGYLAALNLWSLVLIRFRPWHSLTALSFAATWLLFFGAGRLRQQNFLMVEAFAMLFLFFACYGGIGMMRGRPKPEEKSKVSPQAAESGAALVLIGCLAFVIASALILSHIEAFALPALVVIAIFTALLLTVLGLAIPETSPHVALIREFFRYLAAASLILLMGVVILQAQPIQKMQALPAFCFGLFAYLLFLAIAAYTSFVEKAQGPAITLLAANAVSHVMVSFHVLAPVKLWGIHAAPLWLPIAGWLTLAALSARTKEEGKRGFTIAAAISAQFLLFCALCGAFVFSAAWPAKQTIALFFAEFILLSITWLAVSPRMRLLGFRGDLLGAFGNAAIFFGLLAAGARLKDYEGIVLLCGVALAMAAYHAVVGGRLLRRSTDDALHRFIYLGLALTFLTIAIPLQLRASYLTLAWATESAVLIWTGLAAKDRRVRWYGVILLGISTAKALFLDLFESPEPFRLFLNERMLSGAALIATAYVSAWLLWRNREHISKIEIHLPAVFSFIAILFTLIFISLDLWDHLGRILPIQARGNAQQFSLSIFWSIYALALMSAGIWRRLRRVRLFAMGLLYLSILKVFIFDLHFLDTPYRIISFLGLGIILLVVSLLYTRFESRLKC
jgi:uncharacterized membrane protein